MAVDTSQRVGEGDRQGPGIGHFARVDSGGRTGQHIAPRVSGRIGQGDAGRHQVLHQQVM